MAVIKQDELIQSIADAFQYISYYHPADFVRAMADAHEREQSPAAKDAMAQILMNSRMSAEGHRPICQDTGIAVVFLRVGMNVQWDATLSVSEMVNEGVRRAYLHPDNVLRASVVNPPLYGRGNTRDNTPAVIHTEIVPGDTVDVRIAAKGGGSENKAKFAVLNPSDSLVDWVLDTVTSLGAGWCPPGILGIGIGGTPEKSLLMAKEALLDHIDIHEVRAKSEHTPIEALRLELFEKVNQLGIGAQGLGGVTTVLDVKILEHATHAASLPVALIPNCAATRHAHFVLDGSGPVALDPPRTSDWPSVTWAPDAASKKINLETLTAEETRQWRAGDRLLLSGKILTGRDAAHKRLVELMERGEPMPAGVDFTNRLIYYVGPVDATGDEAVGPAGPTTATRMDKFTDQVLSGTGLIGMIGKAERGKAGLEAIKKHRAVYLIAVGGAAYLVSKAIRRARVLAFEDLGMEAIYEFEVEDMPVTVAVDAGGDAVHLSGPAMWRNKLSEIPVQIGTSA